MLLHCLQHPSKRPLGDRDLARPASYDELLVCSLVLLTVGASVVAVTHKCAMLSCCMQSPCGFPLCVDQQNEQEEEPRFWTRSHS